MGCSSHHAALCPLLRGINFVSLPDNRRWSALTSTRMMGGGPRTYPGGVTKWQWKRMQQKKARQIEEARLQRERLIYEMRRRAEIIAAAPVLEKPWERLSRFRSASHVTADEQMRTLASRFEKLGAEDLWTENDGPQTFLRPDGEPSARFFPPNAVHSTKMYRKVESAAAGATSTVASIENRENDMTSGLGILGLSSGVVGSDVASRNDWEETLKSKFNLKPRNFRKSRSDSSLNRHANWKKGHNDP